MINFKDISSLKKQYTKTKKSLDRLLCLYDSCGCIISCIIGRHILIKYNDLTNLINNMIIYYEDLGKVMAKENILGNNDRRDWNDDCKNMFLSTLNLYKCKLEERNILVTETLTNKESISLM